MFGYIVRRLLSAFLVVVLTSMIVFVLFFKGPSNPAEPLCDLNGKCTPEKLALLTEQMGFNEPMAQQYLIFVGGLFHDREIDFGATYHCDAPCLGISYRTRGEVTQELLQKLPATISIAVGGATIYLTLGVLLGTIAARKRGTAVDRGLVAFQCSGLGHSLLRDRPDGVDLHLAAVAADRGHLLPSAHRGPVGVGDRPGAALGVASDSPTPRRTRGTRAAR